MSMTLPQSVLSYISIFWKGDCTSSSLRAMRRPKAEPVWSKFSWSHVDEEEVIIFPGRCVDEAAL
jgi:hypothetical protein